jgi:hypothetical protein
MATRQTQAENAHKVLELFAHLEAVSGTVVGANKLVAIGERQRWKMSDLQQGLEFASAQGWIKKNDRGLELTDQGFAVMPSAC